MITQKFVIGDAGLHLHAERPLKTLSEPAGVYLTEVSEGAAEPDAPGKRVDLTLLRTKQMPEPAGVIAGEGQVLRFYRDRELYYVGAKEPPGFSMLTAYRPDFSEMTVYVDDARFPEAVSTAEHLLFQLPMAELLRHFDLLELHASRIRVGERAILFSARSGTGKTTAARLWERYAGARLVNNDRVLLRRTKYGLLSYGYLIDGSDPVCGADVLPVAAIVLLSQSPENAVAEFSPRRSGHLLLSQTFANPWDTEQLSRMRMEWLDIMERVPVYLYGCRADEDAVRVLRSRLRRDGVL